LHIDRALVDLGARVNVLPKVLFDELGMVELKPTRTIIRLANKSTKVPLGVIEDVLVKIEEFVNPIDFIMLETHKHMDINS
jgi:hypothetical protein